MLSPERTITGDDIHHPRSPYEADTDGAKPEHSKHEHSHTSKSPNSGAQVSDKVGSPRSTRSAEPRPSPYHDHDKRDTHSPAAVEPPTSPYRGERETDSEEKVVDSASVNSGGVASADIIPEERQYDSRFSVYVTDGGDIGVRRSEGKQTLSPTQKSKIPKDSLTVKTAHPQTEEKAGFDAAKDAEKSLETIGLSEKTVFKSIQKILTKQPDVCARLAQTPEDVVSGYPLWLQVVVKYAERIVVRTIVVHLHDQVEFLYMYIFVTTINLERSKLACV